MFDAIILDLDDTLILEVDYVRSGYAAVAAAFAAELGCGEAAIGEELWRIFAGGERGNVIGAWLERRKRSDLLESAIGVYRDHSPNLSLVPGWTELIAYWRHEGIKLGIVTDGRSFTQRQKLRAVGADRLIDAIVVSDELLPDRAAWKPSPEPYLACLSTLGLSHGKAVYVGDNPLKDFLGARRAGMSSVRLNLPLGLHTATPPPSADCAPSASVAEVAALREVVAGLADGPESRWS